MKVTAETVPASREQFMRVALNMAERGMAAGGPPVGACLVRESTAVASAHNSVIGELDITAHAEIVAIRAACRELRTLDLGGCSLYVTVEPCPMCLSACYYAGIPEIFFGASLADMQVVTGSELSISAQQLFAATADVPVIQGGVLQHECLSLLKSWGLAGERAGQ
jgi:tRNA(Arg) A34 adenosine deaminase TadA